MKEEWLKKLREHKEKNGDSITIKELSACTSNGKQNILSYRKIYRNCRHEVLRYTQLGPEDSKCRITIDTNDAEEYLNSFHDSFEDQTPPSKPLFPGFPA